MSRPLRIPNGCGNYGQRRDRPHPLIAAFKSNKNRMPGQNVPVANSTARPPSQSKALSPLSGRPFDTWLISTLMPITIRIPGQIARLATSITSPIRKTIAPTSGWCGLV